MLDEPQRGGHLNPREERATTADWAGPDDVDAWPELVEARKLDRLDGAFLVGGAGDGRTWLGYRDDRHLVTIAGSRAGKGTSAIVPNLALWPGPVIVTDPKGENAAMTAARRAGMGQQVAVIDPFGTTDGTPAASYRAAFNPLDAVVRSSEPVDTAALIADALIVQESGPGSHFTMAARNLLHGLILWCAVHGPRNADAGHARGSLLDVRDALTGAEKPLKGSGGKRGTLDEMVEIADTGDHEADPAIAQSARSFLDKPENEAGSVLSTAHEHTAFLASPQIREAVAQSSLDLAGLRWRATGADAPLSLYIALPARYLSTHGRLMRLMVTLACTAVEAAGDFDGAREGPRVLACLDEFPVLGHLSVIESAAGYMAGFGLILWSVLQDLGQLKRHYREGWETFLGNAGLVQAFGNTDATTLDYLQKRLGDRAILTENISSQGLQAGQTSVSHGIQTVPLLRAEEIARTFSRASGRQLVLPAGRRPVIASRVPWPADKTLHRMIAG